jgi:hypothetical protein
MAENMDQSPLRKREVIVGQALTRISHHTGKNDNSVISGADIPVCLNSHL